MFSTPFLAALAVVPIVVRAALNPNLACNGTGLDWYKDMAGETPCETYQHLRQICNANYAVGVQKISTPPDTCNDQVSGCCCNSIAFALSMLCLNCQQNIGTSAGLDAGAGAFQIYLNNGGRTSCPNPLNGKLPTDVQKAVCNSKIKINDDLYPNRWADGSWFYVFTRDTILKDIIATNNNTFTRCPSATISSSTSKSRSASSSSAATSSGAPPAARRRVLATGAIAGGIAVAGFAVLAGLIAALWWCRRRRRRGTREGGPGSLLDGREPETAVVDDAHVVHAYNYTSPITSPSSEAPPTTFGSSGGQNYSLGSTATSPGASWNASMAPTSPGTSASMSGSTSRAGTGPGAWTGTGRRSKRDTAASQPVVGGNDAPSEDERHVDAGPVEGAQLGRSPSGRLPPAYGVWGAE
ncbi:hypothetical protein B0H15DRAFT_32620 [Mycena belliarum]|uniref:Uncharacterized protein n=1 Tax=Mycena belliarum TaxID=1033014 RepID=A0AAD6XSV1_9AGAR|nr:hypothetical protein B0H15DRAFT_32620 [Mycena belliae]